MSSTVLITGCRSGIGLEAALAVAGAGHTVYAGLRDLDTREELVDRASDLDIRPIQLDITDADQRQQAVAQICTEAGSLDALVNNAGVAMGGFLEQLSEDALRRVFEVNVFGSWAMTREALPLLREARGLVVFVSSLSGRMAIPGAGAYVTSKFAMEGMGETWRHELAPHGVRVVLLQPGAIRTPMTTTKLDFVRPAPGDPYAPYAQRVEAWYRANVTDQGADPALVGAAVRDLLTQETPDLRQLVGPRTRLRSLAVRFLPFSAIEAFWARVLRRGAT